MQLPGREPTTGSASAKWTNLHWAPVWVSQFRKDHRYTISVGGRQYNVLVDHDVSCVGTQLDWLVEGKAGRCVACKTENKVGRSGTVGGRQAIPHSSDAFGPSSRKAGIGHRPENSHFLLRDGSNLSNGPLTIQSASLWCVDLACRRQVTAARACKHHLVLVPGVPAPKRAKELPASHQEQELRHCQVKSSIPHWHPNNICSMWSLMWAFMMNCKRRSLLGQRKPPRTGLKVGGSFLA